MKYDDTIDILKTFANAFFDPSSITRNSKKSMILKYSQSLNSSYDNNNNNNAESENSNQENNESVPKDDNGYYDDNNNNSKNNNYYNKNQNTSSNPQGIIDSIAEELTSARLQQAIILSEIVGAPRSKNRRKRRRF